MRRCFPIIAVLSVLVHASGCAVVRPWERQRLASPAMDARFGEEGFAGEYRGKTLESKMGGRLPGDAPGGGCGCTH